MAKSPTIKITLTSEDRTAKGFQSAEMRISGFKRGLSTAGVAIGSFAGNLLAQSVPAIGSFGRELFDLGQATDTMAKKAAKVFGPETSDIKKWADGINESLGLSDEAVVGLAANMGDLLIPMKFTREEAAELTKTNLNAAGALSAWTGGTYDAAEVADIMTKAMLGEREQLKQLGISINQAEVNQRALTIATRAGRTEITEQDKALATQQLILEKSADAQEAWADGTMDAQKAQNELSAAVADVKEDLARALVPAVQRTVRFLAQDLVPAIKSVVAEFRERWPEIKAAVQPVLDWFREKVETVVGFVSAFWAEHGAKIVEFTTTAFEAIREIVGGVLDVIIGIVDVFFDILEGNWGDAWDGIVDILKGVVEAIKGVVKLGFAAVRLAVRAALSAIKSIVSSGWSAVKNATTSALSAVVGFVRGLPKRARDALASIGSTLFQKGKDLIRGLWNGLVDVWGRARAWVASIPQKMKDALWFAATTLVTTGKNFIVGLWNGLINKWNDARAWVGDIPGKIAGAFWNAGRWLWDAGRRIMQGLWDGLKSKFESVKNWLSGLGRTITNLKGPPSHDSVMLRDNGRRVMSGFLVGMREGWTDVARFLGGVSPRLRGDVGAQFSAAGGTSIASTRGAQTVNRGSTTIVQNLPTGVHPTNTTQATRRYARIQGEL